MYIYIYNSTRGFDHCSFEYSEPCKHSIGFQKHHLPPVGHLESAYPFVQVQSPSSACLLERIYGTENALNHEII